MSGDPFDDYLDDDEGDFSRFREDGWTHEELLSRDHLIEGRYAGAKDEQ